MRASASQHDAVIGALEQCKPTFAPPSTSARHRQRRTLSQTKYDGMRFSRWSHNPWDGAAILRDSLQYKCQRAADPGRRRSPAPASPYGPHPADGS